MEVELVKDEKLWLEKELYRLISEFEEQTGTYITGIDMLSIRRYSDSFGDVSFYRSGGLTVSVEVMS